MHILSLFSWTKMKYQFSQKCSEDVWKNEWRKSNFRSNHFSVWFWFLWCCIMLHLFYINSLSNPGMKKVCILTKMSHFQSNEKQCRLWNTYSISIIYLLWDNAGSWWMIAFHHPSVRFYLLSLNLWTRVNVERFSSSSEENRIPKKHRPRPKTMPVDNLLSTLLEERRKTSIISRLQAHRGILPVFISSASKTTVRYTIVFLITNVNLFGMQVVMSEVIYNTILVIVYYKLFSSSKDHSWPVEFSRALMNH